MTVRRIDPNTGDIATSGQQFIKPSAEAIAQRIKTRLNLFTGEYFRDITDGTPWFETILGKGSTVSQREAALRTRIVRTDGVLQLIKFTTDFDITTRRYDVSCVVLTEYGQIDVQTTGGV